MIESSENCSIIRLQKCLENEQIEIYEYNEEEIINILKKCYKSNAFDISIAPIIYDDFDYCIFLDDGEDLWQILLGEKSQCSQGYGKLLYNIHYAGNIMEDLNDALVKSE